MKVKKCPYCAETIQDEARICRFCNRELGIESSQSVGEKVINETSGTSASLKLASDLCSGISFIFVLIVLFLICCGFVSGFSSLTFLYSFVTAAIAGALWWVSFQLKNRSKIAGIIGFIVLGLLTCAFAIDIIMNTEKGITMAVDFWSSLIMLLLVLTTVISLAISWGELN